ncbi:MAG: biotin--[acetyl-CoA-carboxylase] ligase [Acidobacteria bacterium]|nr:biotin--[acetyl-CoA-carboxylase] ligase [Acidobacteriota bacterium]
MIVLADSRAYAEWLLEGAVRWLGRGEFVADESDRALREALLGEGDLEAGLAAGEWAWERFAILERAARSQWDALVELCSGPGLARTVAAFAGTGAGFHGQHGRPWASPAGNIHLVAHFRPQTPAANLGFTLVPALAALDTVDAWAAPAAAPGIKWINDIVADSRKLGGVIAWSRTSGATVRDAIVGIGLNVERAPELAEPGLPPAALREIARAPADCAVPAVLRVLLERLAARWDEFRAAGLHPLLDEYRRRSTVLGREVAVRDGSGALIRGRVVAIGDELELFLEGRDEPLRSGRIA